jgi:hypothetical protein
MKVHFIHIVIQKLVKGNVGASDSQQAQPLALRTLAKERRIALLQEEQGRCNHKSDTASCKDEDADEASGQFLNHDVYTPFCLFGPLKLGRNAQLLHCEKNIADLNWPKTSKLQAL